MDLVKSSPHLFRAISSHPAGVRFALDRLAEIHDGAAANELGAYLRSLDSTLVSEAAADPTFRHMHGTARDIDRRARLWAALRPIGEAIQAERLGSLRSRAHGRPLPYSMDDFQALEIDAEGLTSVAALEYDRSRYSYAESSALMLATTGAPNSTHWLAGHLANLPEFNEVRIRLDPLLWGPKSEFPCMLYKMWVYGQPLDWDRIASIREPEHGRWVGDSPFSKGELTEYAWSPRDARVHFEIEEMPQQIERGLTSARYLHAIFDPRRRILEHVDGALRVYSASEQRSRLAVHLTDAPKDGVRAKVFRVDGEISLADFSNVAATFFVWNRDVQTYFGAPTI